MENFANDLLNGREDGHMNVFSPKGGMGRGHQEGHDTQATVEVLILPTRSAVTPSACYCGPHYLCTGGIVSDWIPFILL